MHYQKNKTTLIKIFTMKNNTVPMKVNKPTTTQNSALSSKCRTSYHACTKNMRGKTQYIQKNPKKSMHVLRLEWK